MIAALAGRRAVPEHRIAAVEDAIAQTFLNDGIRDLVCSGACGADLLALRAAGNLGIRARIILPYDAALFRERSVVDRNAGEEWGEIYDTVITIAVQSKLLRRLGIDPADPAVYEKTNDAILDEAQAIATTTKQNVEAIAVWDADRKEAEADYTALFVDEARRRGIEVRTIPVLTNGRPE